MAKTKTQSTALYRARTKEAEKHRLLADEPDTMPRWMAYDCPVIPIDNNAKPTAKTCKQADVLFEQMIQKASIFKTSKIEDKKKHWRNLLHALNKAAHKGGCVMHTRNKTDASFSKIRLQVIECAIEQKLIYEVQSPPGSPKMSRLFDMRKVRQHLKTDPQQFDPNIKTQFVYLVKRDDKTEVPVDFAALHPNHIANEYQRRLELINQVNSLYKITHEHYCPFERDFVGIRILRPIHYCKFTERWDWHGRIYTGQYGHQSLRPIERRTLLFNNCASVELDYSGMHPRLLYHLNDIDYRKDPYKLWGKKTTKEQRTLAKLLINIALNAKTRKAAISECHKAMSTWTDKLDKKTKKRIRKTGDSLEKAITLHQTYKQSGLKFADIYDLVLRRHKPIAQYFGSDAGIWLMRADSSIAIDIMYSFAKQAIPCLCVHDSFIVPQIHEQELREKMNEIYHLHTGFHPVVK